MNRTGIKRSQKLEITCTRVNLLLFLAIIFSGLAIVNITDKRRHLFVQLERATAEQRRLAQQWTRLQYEHSVLSKTERIERIAKEKLKMHPAMPDRTIYFDGKTFKPIESTKLPK